MALAYFNPSECEDETDKWPRGVGLVVALVLSAGMWDFGIQYVIWPLVTLVRGCI